MDLSVALKPAVYILRLRGRVVFIGAAQKPLVRLYAHVNHRRGKPAPAWLPVRPIEFDAIELRPCRVEELETSLANASAEHGWEPRATFALPPKEQPHA